MKKFYKFLSVCLIASHLLWSVQVKAESVTDRFTQITPTHSPGSGEFVHGQGYGKILIRVLLLGSVSLQGVHYFPEGTDLLFSILYSGGMGETTKLNGIHIRRRGVKELMEVDLADLIEDGNAIPKLQDGDVVEIPYNWKRDVATITFVTGFISAITAFTLSLLALRNSNTAH